MKILKIFLTLLMMLLISCSPIRYDGPYKGRVVDVDTGHPIAGAVVLGVWYTEMPTPSGGVRKYHDAMETVTDKKGNFEIRGQGLLLFSTVSPMHVLIFKAGYEYVGEDYWDSFKEQYPRLSKKVSWEGSQAVLLIRRLEMEKRKMDPHYPPIPPTDVPLNKIRRMLQEINKDLIMYGFKPMTVWQGGKI